MDGEGSISIGLCKPRINSAGRKTRSSLKLQVTVVNTNRSVLDWILETFGIGTVGRKCEAQPHRQECHSYRVTDFGAEQVIRALLPHLRVKREQALLALEFRELGQAKPFQRISDVNITRALELKDMMHRAKGTASSLNRSSFTN